MADQASPFNFGSTDNHSYDPTRFYTDLNGADSYRMTIRMPLWVDDALAQLQKIFPAYASMSDFLRDAGVHRMYQLRELKETPELMALIRQYESWAAASAQQTKQQAVRETFKVCQAQYQQAETQSEITAAREVIETIAAETTDPEWSQRFLNIIRK